MFKIGDIVTIKQMSEHNETYDVLNRIDRIGIPKYQGTTGHVTHIAENVSNRGFKTQNYYYVRFSDGESCWWLEEWLEPSLSYEAF